MGTQSPVAVMVPSPFCCGTTATTAMTLQRRRLLAAMKPQEIYDLRHSTTAPANIN
ncbi:MAG: hypothetical protein U0528_02650 [Anaerolineae bacterium]